MSKSRWRNYARPIIARVLRETAGLEERAVRAALREAYPFGERAYHPYKIWRSEVRRQRGLERNPEGEPEAPGALLALMEGEHERAKS